jgi:hypothetical protein
LVRRQIELKFGALDADALAHLDAADETTLVRMGERVLTATSIEESCGTSERNESERDPSSRQSSSRYVTAAANV